MMDAEQLPRPEPPDLPDLSEEHVNVLVDGSCIDPAELAEQEVRTINHGRELPHGFSRRQRRRGAGILFTLPRPNGGVSHSFRPNAPDPENPGRKYEQMPKRLGSPGNTLGIYQSFPGALANPSAPLVFVEGAKKGLSLLSWARSTGRLIVIVVINGVWNWLSKGVPIPDMLALPVEGRECRIAFDSDWRSKANVHDALARLDAYLKSRGGVVLIWDIPHSGDGKTGLDDYRAGGGNVENLERDAHPFEPVDVGAERLTQDEKLRATVESLEADLQAMPARKMAECTERAVFRDLMGAVPRDGKLREDGAEVEVERSLRRIANGAQTGLRAVSDALARMEAAGRLRREYEGRAKHQPGTYVLLTPWRGGRALGKQEGEEERLEGKEGQEGEGFSPLSNEGCHPGVSLTRAPLSEAVPVLRWPKVILTWERREGKHVVVDSYYVARLAKRREEMIRYVLEAGGRATEVELLERFGGKTTRLRDFRRRMLGPIEAEGIFTLSGGIVALTDRWRAALEEARERTGELEDSRLQAEKYKRQQESYRRSRELGIKADPTPELPGREKMRQIMREAAKRDEAARIEEQRRKVGKTAEVFIHDQLTNLGRIRLGLLKELWAGEGGDPSHVWYAARRMRCKLEKLPEHGNALFVFPPKNHAGADAPVRSELAAVVPLRYREEKPSQKFDPVSESPSRADDWRSHDLDCECPSCFYSEPSYARPRGSA